MFFQSTGGEQPQSWPHALSFDLRRERIWLLTIRKALIPTISNEIICCQSIFISLS